jgi:cell division protein FtsQ
MRRRYRKSLRVKRKKPIYKNGFFWRVILFFLVSGGIFYLLFLSPFFQIREIKISGNKKISTEQILSQVQAKIEQKLLFFTTRSIILVNLNQIKKEILEKFPQIDEVYFKRKFPAILELEIEERKPVAIFNFEENYFFIDKKGVIFEAAEDESSLPKIENSLLTEKPELGEKVINEELISKILKISSELENLKVKISEVKIVSDERINIKTSQDWEIYFDPQKDLSWQLTKLKVDLENLIPFERRKDLEYIDLRFGDSAPFKYR